MTPFEVLTQAARDARIAASWLRMTKVADIVVETEPHPQVDIEAELGKVAIIRGVLNGE